VEGALDLAIGEGLDALGKGDRLLALGFSSLRAAPLAGEVRLRHAHAVRAVEGRLGLHGGYLRMRATRPAGSSASDERQEPREA